MRDSGQTDKIDAQIALVQSEIEHVTKDKTVEVAGERAAWKSGYATLSALDTAARPACKKHGIAIYQGGGFVQGLGPVLETRLAYQGQWIESFYPIKAQGDGAQKLGAGISFARRWGLCGMLGLVADDAEEAQGYTEARRDARPARKGQAPTGIAEALASIRGAQSTGDLFEVAKLARGAFPTGEAAGAVEKAIDAWFITELDSPTITAEGLIALRAEVARLRARSTDVRAAIQRAEARVKGGGA